MHEYSVVSSLIDAAERFARANGGTRLFRLELRLGELSGVDPDLLVTAFTTFREHTLCAGADLDIVRVPAVWRCPKCSVRIAAGAPLRCAACEAPASLESGDDLILQKIEMEVSHV
jgi:hydrogenase nickel incorporation protein HypA/HybF